MAESDDYRSGYIAGLMAAAEYMRELIGDGKPFHLSEPLTGVRDHLVDLATRMQDGEPVSFIFPAVAAGLEYGVYVNGALAPLAAFRYENDAKNWADEINNLPWSRHRRVVKPLPKKPTIAGMDEAEAVFSLPGSPEPRAVYLPESQVKSFLLNYRGEIAGCPVFAADIPDGYVVVVDGKKLYMTNLANGEITAIPVEKQERA